MHGPVNVKLIFRDISVGGELIEARECLLSFGAESFVFKFAIQKFKDLDIKNYNSACCVVWV